MDESQLINRCKKNDIQAFEELILGYEKKIFNLCYYTLRNREDASDVSQEVCLKIFKYISSFKGDSKFSTWVYRITYNACIDYLKKKKDELSYDDVINNENEKNFRVEGIIEANELKLEIKRCILNLSNDFRSVIILRDINGLSYQEIAEILSIEVGTVKSRINRAREALKKELTICGIARR